MGRGTARAASPCSVHIQIAPPCGIDVVLLACAAGGSWITVLMSCVQGAGPSMSQENDKGFRCAVVNLMSTSLQV